MPIKKIAVIGAGLGGLSASIRLAVKGFKVDVFEQNSHPGGKASEITQNGFRFDAGPSLLTMPFVIEELFSETGRKMNDYLNLKKLDPLCRYFYDDGTIINAFSSAENFAGEIESNTHDKAADILKYLNYCNRIYDLTAGLFLFSSPSSIKTYLNKNAIKALFNLRQIDPFRTMHQANKNFFSDSKVIQLFDRYSTYSGSNPYKAPATLNIIPHVEFNMGGYLPEGGIYSITQALKNLAGEVGVNLYYNSKVSGIITKGRNVKGIKTEDDEIDYDAVISNVDVNYTYQKLIKNKSGKNNKYKAIGEPSLSGVVFYWGVKGIHSDLEVHNIIFSENYKKEFEDIFDNKSLPEDPTIYIYISSKHNPADAPGGFENWFVMVNAPFIENQNWEEEIKTARQRVISKINSVLHIDINKKIIFENILTPYDLKKKTGSYKGSIYGISSNSKTSAFKRHPNKSKKYKGLYFCGGSVHPGGGIPLVLLSGKLAAELMINDFKV